MTNDSEIETELTIQKFIIFPRDKRIILKKKVEKEIKTVSIGFDFLKMTFFAERDDGSSINIKSFNEYLVTEFLQIDFSNKLLVRYALGYNRGVDLYTGETNNIENTNSLPKNTVTAPVVRNKDKDKLIDRLKDALGLSVSDGVHKPSSSTRSGTVS